MNDLATDYLEGRLSFVTRLRYRRHLRRCSPCASFLEQIETTIQLLGHMPCENLCPEKREQLMECFRDWKKERE